VKGIKMELTITDQNFDQEVLTGEKPVLVDFWAEWCGPCKMVSPAVSELAEELKDHLKVGKLNVDENPKSSQKYQIFSIPALKIFKGGKIIGEIIGAAPKHVIEQKIKSIIGI
jgi:thioredoxin 1